MEQSAPSYGKCFASLALGLAPLFLILGVAAIFGANTVTANGHNVYGLTGLIVAIILNIVFAAVFAGLQKLGFIFLGPFKRFRQKDEV
jgi:hypothetical protein